MQYPAQVQACIELMTVQLNDRSVADRLLYNYFRGRRYIGSKDRAVITELFYAVLRQRLRIEYILNELGVPIQAENVVAASLWLDGVDVDKVYTGDKYQPQALEEGVLEALDQIDVSSIEFPLNVQCNVPRWLMPSFERRFGDDTEQELLALNQTASVDVRTNTLVTDRDQLLEQFKSADIQAHKTPLSNLGIRFEQRIAVSNLETFKIGAFEVQDEGSQLLAAVCRVKAGQKVIDFCAGAGGKTLALAAAMQNKGTLIACDISEPRLKELSRRAKRAGVFNIRPLLLKTEHDKQLKRHIKSADWVLIDAPCSGAGAWRRNPDARFNLSPERLQELRTIQSAILESAARLVKPNGHLVYATCSVLAEENTDQIDSFINNNKDLYTVMDVQSSFSPEVSSGLTGDVNTNLIDYLSSYESPYLELSPARSETDGFFAALIQRTMSAADH